MAGLFEFSSETPEETHCETKSETPDETKHGSRSEAQDGAHDETPDKTPGETHDDTILSPSFQRLENVDCQTQDAAAQQVLNDRYPHQADVVESHRLVV